ncbi:hypothetical protein QEJ31_01475 [Pigmentibacter sp. JX0631]|uniref:hypothetical protein n=1 Tax=Pigmentibacter sp. JX0631 TaxID=2976982 RepID=UPI0024686A99|nr:hypothetical protein [Pigmentibacter sp. JX0631]WGL60275.1 hypothetical protein QEJ31_01475 [Pigmentibacter sp. JX0631]
MITFIAILALIVFPKVSSFKAKGQQSEARIKLVKVYNSLYAYRLENGTFIDTQQKIVYLEDLKELDPYIKEDFYKKSNKNDKVFLISSPDKFAAAYVRVLSNGEFDIQRINSKKQFCYMLNGLEDKKVNCELSQNYSEKNKSDEVKYAQKLKILEND